MRIVTRDDPSEFAPFDLNKTPKFNRKTDKIQLTVCTYELANAYYYASKMLFEKNPLFYISVALSNAAFACELYLKALLHGYNIDFGNIHGLSNLFNKLPDNIQEYIEQNIAIENRETEFRLCLVEQNDAFVAYRYMNEAKEITVNTTFIVAFAHILKFVYEDIIRQHSEVDE